MSGKHKRKMAIIMALAMTMTMPSMSFAKDSGSLAKRSEKTKLGVVSLLGHRRMSPGNSVPQVVNFNKNRNTMIKYVEEGTGKSGYLISSSAADGVYLGTFGGKVRFMVSGVIGLVDQNAVGVEPFRDDVSVSCYKVSNGRLMHYISGDIHRKNYRGILDNGAAPSYLRPGITYYSYDGHYFYTDYQKMAEDCQVQTRHRSVNPNSPFYNYYQFLPFRSKTVYSEAEFNSILNQKLRSNSQMVNLGQEFIRQQNQHGVNGILIASIAANESAWGTSNIARQKNNLFGWRAVDSSPGQSASTFSSPAQCVDEYMGSLIAKKYLNPKWWGYNGGFLGNKGCGFGVNYASDPYWGETAAAIAYKIESSSSKRDVNRYTYLIKDPLAHAHTNVNIRKGPSVNDAWLYYSGSFSSGSMIALSTQPENGFYKIQSDAPLNGGRTGVAIGDRYDFSRDYAYISAKFIDVIRKGEASISSTSNSSSKDLQARTSNPSVVYQAHSQDFGWLSTVENGEEAGTTGRGKRMEAIRIAVRNLPVSGDVEYQVHGESYGWSQGWKSNSDIGGTTGQAKRLEAIRIRLTGEAANRYSIYYRTHCENVGWLGWAKDGEAAGTAGNAKRMEAIEIRLVPKGQAGPYSISTIFIDKGQQITSKPNSESQPSNNSGEATVAYTSHRESYGWENDWKANGAISGSTGKAKRLEAVKIKLVNPPVSGGIEYSAHLKNIGWGQGYVADGNMAGTVGEARRMEAIKIRLTGDMANHYDVYYCVHSQNKGWLGWAKNDEPAGTAGYCYRAEALKVVLVPKGGAAPAPMGTIAEAFVQK